MFAELVRVILNRLGSRKLQGAKERRLRTPSSETAVASRPVAPPWLVVASVSKVVDARPASELRLPSTCSLSNELELPAVSEAHDDSRTALFQSPDVSELRSSSMAESGSSSGSTENGDAELLSRLARAAGDCAVGGHANEGPRPGAGGHVPKYKKQ